MKDETMHVAGDTEQTEGATPAAVDEDTGLTPEQLRNIDRAFRDAEAWCVANLPSEASRAPRKG